MTYAVRLGGLKIRLTPFKEVLQSSCRYIFAVPQVPDQQQQDGKGDNVSKFFFHLIGTEGMHPGAICQSPVRFVSGSVVEFSRESPLSSGSVRHP